MENNTVFILLAGGKSQRMNVAKGLLKFKQTFWILEQLDRISKSNISTVCIGLGYQFEHYFKAIPWLYKAQTTPVKFQNLTVHVMVNNTPSNGAFSTLQTVLKKIKIPHNILVNPIDVPILNTSELNNLIATDNWIVIPSYNNKNGHPIKLNSAFCKHLLTLDASDKEARLDLQIKKVNPSKKTIVQVNDCLVLKNLNTPEVWKDFIKMEINSH